MAVKKWPSLKTPVNVKSFPGLCGFYQRFVPDYATVVAPLTDLVRKKCRMEMGRIAGKDVSAIEIELFEIPSVDFTGFQ